MRSRNQKCKLLHILILNPPSPAGDPVLPRVHCQGLHVVQVVVDGLQGAPHDAAIPILFLALEGPRADGLVHRARVENAAPDADALPAVVVA